MVRTGRADTVNHSHPHTGTTRRLNDSILQPLAWFGGTAWRILGRPGSFFEALPRPGGAGQAAMFLGLCGALFAGLAGVVLDRYTLLFGTIFFLNAVITPLVTAAVLFLVTKVLCRGAFTFEDLFRIVAYANATLLLAWIPGVNTLTGLWKLYLIGLGMTKLGGLNAVRTWLSLVIAVAVLLLLIQVLPSMEHLVRGLPQG